MRRRCEVSSAPQKAVCEHNQIAVNHLLQLGHLSYFGTQRYKTTIIKAVRSVCVYPLPIESEKDALALDGVGKFLAREIMKSFGAVAERELPEAPPETAVLTVSSGRDPLYKPEHGRGPWGVMVALRFLNGRGTKDEVTQCISTNSIEMETGALDGSKWSTCLRTLRKKGIITETSSSEFLELTTLGTERVALLKSNAVSVLEVPLAREQISIDSPPAVQAPSAVPQFTLDLTQEEEAGEQADLDNEPEDLLTCYDISHPSDEDEDKGDSSDIFLSQPEEPEAQPRSLRDRLVAAAAAAQPLPSFPVEPSSEGLLSKRKIDEVEIFLEPQHLFHPSNRGSSGPQVEEEDSISLSQPTTERDKRRCHLLRRVPSATAQTFSLTRTQSTGPQIRPERQELHQEAPSIDDWEVVILIDRREKDHSFFESFFTEKGVRNEVCQLAVGDYLWVAKRKSASWAQASSEDGATGYLSDSSVDSISFTQSSRGGNAKRSRSKSIKERLEEMQSSVLVLDCVVERKTVNDLASSIVDGRYEEQKCRLQDCGVANCVYLVEGASLNPQGVRSREKGTGIGSSGGAAGGGGTINTNAIITALAATQAVGVATGMCRTETSSDSDEEQSAPLPKRDPPSFHVVNTRGLDHTATHLLCLHRLVQQRFFSSFSSPFLQNQRTLSEFQANSSRKQRLETMSDLLVTQLRQLPGCSTSAAEAISKRFGGTMSNLHFSLSSLDSVAAVDSLAEVKKIGRTGALSRVGPVLSRSLVTLLLQKRSSSSAPRPAPVAPSRRPPSVVRSTLKRSISPSFSPTSLTVV